MSLSHYKKLQLKYQNASLPIKISVPFILMFLGFWIAGTTSVGYFLAQKLEQGEHKRTLELVTLIKREIDQELDILRKDARLLSTNEPISQAITAQDELRIRQLISPLKGIVNANIITIINRDKNELLTLQDPILKGIELKTKEVNKLLVTGVDISTVAETKDFGPPVLIGTASIKNRQGIVGGILIGTVLNDQLLAQINQPIKEHIVIISNGIVVASTFPSDAFSSNQKKRLETPKNHSTIKINNQNFAAHLISLRGIENEQTDLVLLTSQTSLNQAKQTTWLLIMTMASVGAVLTIVLGYWIANHIDRSTGSRRKPI